MILSQSYRVSALLLAGLCLKCALAQEAALNYMAITGWYEGCNNGRLEPLPIREQRCDGRTYTPLPDPLHLEFDICYVNPTSPSSVTYYTHQASSGQAVEFNIIFTNDEYARMPTICNEQGICICGTDFGRIQQEVGTVSCNDLFSVTYQCKSREISEVSPLEASTCYVPHSAALLLDGETKVECSMVASIESVPPASIVAATAAPITAPSTPPPAIVLTPTSAPVAAATVNPIVATTSEPSIVLEPTPSTNFPVNLRPTTPPVPSPTYFNVVNGKDVEDDNESSYETNPGLLSAAALVGFCFLLLVLWAGRPEEGYRAAMHETYITWTNCCTKCARCDILPACCCRRRGDDARGVATTAGYYHKTPDDTKTEDKVWGKNAEEERYNDALSLASVSQASLTQATTLASNQTPTKAGLQKRYLMMVEEEKADFLPTALTNKNRSHRPHFRDGAISDQDDESTDDVLSIA